MKDAYLTGFNKVVDILVAGVSLCQTVSASYQIWHILQQEYFSESHGGQHDAGEMLQATDNKLHSIVDNL